MKINPYMQVQNLYTSQNVNKAEKAVGTGRTDALELSGFAKDLQTAKSAVTQVEDVREEITSPIKEAMEDGTYEVTESSFADKLLGGI